MWQLLDIFLVLNCWCCCFLFAVILVAQGERQKREVYSLIPSLIHRIDKACEFYLPPTIHFFVVAPNPIIVPPHSTLHSSASSTPYPRWLMVFPFSYFPFPFFFLFFLIPLPFPMQYGYSALILFLS